MQDACLSNLLVMESTTLAQSIHKRGSATEPNTMVMIVPSSIVLTINLIIASLQGIRKYAKQI